MVAAWAGAAVALVLVPGATRARAQGVEDPAALVDPFVGTGAAVVPGADPAKIDTFPGATVPFGMVQWSPDTYPNRRAGGGYAIDDHVTSGFSLTHLSGPGCPVGGDLPILPVAGPPPADPDTATEPFSHATEHANPGFYSVSVGAEPVSVSLTATSRTGLGAFVFPRGVQQTILLKGDGSAAGVDHNTITVAGADEVLGSATTGHFCSTTGSYTIHYAVRFDRAFREAGTWIGSTKVAARQCTAGSSTGPSNAVFGAALTAGGGGCGAWLSFDSSSPVVRVKVGLSYTSTAEAQANLDAEGSSWDIATVQRRARSAWDDLLGRIAVSGGTKTGRTIFYTALYHSLLHPNVFSDADGSYLGFDGLVHDARGYIQYANYSAWDTYRTEVPLQALIAPAQTSDMMQSLVADAAQAGWLPKWPVANTESDEMNGDSADAILASAWAFGARRFDAVAALQAMSKGATVPAIGPSGYPERQDLAEYEARGWIHEDARDLTSPNYTIGGSETLEYAIDDFAVSRLAAALGDDSLAAAMLRRSANWRALVNPATRYLSARAADGSFPSGPAFQASSDPSLGQDGWEEGNSIQYSWSVPQDLRGLFDAMGGNPVVVARLDRFFSRLNAGRRQPYEWAGNEPALGIPWEYDYAGAPWRTQDVVHTIAASLYTETPGGEPGNDDLGAMASWYVWAAIGLYPETPGTGDLVLSSPLFDSVTIRVPGRPQIAVHATTESGARFIRRAVFTGPTTCGPVAWDRPWVPASAVRSGFTLDLDLGTTPDRAWGAAPSDAPPSFPGRPAVSRFSAVGTATCGGVPTSLR